jgi:DNA-binding MarR family transcriptional regulator
VATLVRKGFIDQVPDADDQRQRLLRITRAGSKLWQELATTIRVLQAATGRLNDHLSEGNAHSRIADRPAASV